MAVSFPCKSFREVREDKSGGDRDVCPGSDDKKLGSRQSPAMNGEGKDLGVDRKRTCPRSQSSVTKSQSECAFPLIRAGRRLVLSRGVPCLISVEMICVAGQPSATALRASLPTMRRQIRDHHLPGKIKYTNSNIQDPGAARFYNYYLAEARFGTSGVSKF